jgi:hypothetical protein
MNYCFICLNFLFIILVFIILAEMGGFDPQPFCKMIDRFSKPSPLLENSYFHKKPVLVNLLSNLCSVKERCCSVTFDELAHWNVSFFCGERRCRSKYHPWYDWFSRPACRPLQFTLQCL